MINGSRIFYMVWNLPRIGRSGTGSQLRSVRAGKSVEGLKTVCSFWKDVQDYSVISPISSFFDRLQSLIEKQRKEEEFLESDRIYKPRAGDDV